MSAVWYECCVRSSSCCISFRFATSVVCLLIWAAKSELLNPRFVQQSTSMESSSTRPQFRHPQCSPRYISSLISCPIVISLFVILFIDQSIHLKTYHLHHLQHSPRYSHIYIGPSQPGLHLVYISSPIVLVTGTELPLGFVHGLVALILQASGAPQHLGRVVRSKV